MNCKILIGFIFRMSCMFILYCFWNVAMKNTGLGALVKLTVGTRRRADTFFNCLHAQWVCVCASWLWMGQMKLNYWISTAQRIVSVFVHPCSSSHWKVTRLSSSNCGTVFNMSLAWSAFCWLVNTTNVFTSGNFQSASEVGTLTNVILFKLQPKFICWHSWECIYYLIKKN